MWAHSLLPEGEPYLSSAAYNVVFSLAVSQVDSCGLTLFYQKVSHPPSPAANKVCLFPVWWPGRLMWAHSLLPEGEPSFALSGSQADSCGLTLFYNDLFLPTFHRKRTEIRKPLHRLAHLLIFCPRQIGPNWSHLGGLEAAYHSTCLS